MSNQKNNNGNSSGRKSARASSPRKKRTATDTETEARLQVEEARRRAKEEAEAEKRANNQKTKTASRRGEGDSGGKKSKQSSGNKRQRSKSSSNKRSKKGSSGGQKKSPKSSSGGQKQSKKDNLDHVTRKLKEDDDTLEAEDLGDIDPVEYGVEWLETVLGRMNFNVDVEGKKEGEGFYFDVSGDDSEVLLGVGSNKPRSVEALQTLLSAALGRYTDSGNITLDVGGFRDMRTDDLEGVARQLGEDAERIGKKITIAGFSSQERRVIHDALKGQKSLSTESTGDGIFRKISIKPN